MNINERITIYYFSATGNSLKISLDIASHFKESDVFKIDTTTPTTHPDSQVVGFIFPVYMGGLPKIVDKFLQHFPFRKDIYYFSVGTYYLYKGSALSVVNKRLKNKGVALNYAGYLPSIGNCLMEYEVSREKRMRILKHTDKVTERLVQDIKNKTEKRASRYCKLSDKMHRKLYSIFFDNAYKKFSLEERCIGCGICAKICPVNNISIEDKRPQWGMNCEACHACVHACPKNAINLGKSKGRLQYRNPHIKRELLLK